MAAVLSGLLSALSLPAVFVTPWASYPLPDLGFLAWIALIPLYAALAKAGTAAAGFRKGFVYGAVHFGMTLYWIVIALHRYGEVSFPVSVLGWAAAVSILALFPAAGAAAAVWLRKRGIPFGPAWIGVTIALEFLRVVFPFGGFPWSNLAYSQRSFSYLLQLLDLTGVFGPLLLILLGNVALAEIRRAKAYAAVFLVLFVAAMAYGHVRLETVRRDAAARPTLRVGIVQGNIPQEEKWEDDKIDDIIDHHMKLTERLQSKEPDLTFWPEAAFPAVLPPEIGKIAELRGLTAPLLMGVVRFDGTMPESWPPKETDSFRLYNSAVLVKAEGEIEDRYDKVHLVPMGEYVPFQSSLPFLHAVAEEMSSFTPGAGLHLLEAAGRKFGVTICYEDLFPAISRAFTNQGAEFLVNLTNDGWYERSSAVFQHLDFSRYRAVENRRAMVRVTNTGVTAVFSPTGETLASLPPFEEGTLTATVPVGGLPSVYARFGDWFAWVCIGGLVLVLLWSLKTRKMAVRSA